MATDRLKSTFESVYRDDFKDSDNYHRILFNSGRALQARELTQMQTIIQKEMERFGSNVFKAGANVLGGSASSDRRYSFIKLDTSVNTLPSDYLTSVVGTSFTGASSDVKFRVTKVVPAENSDPDTLYVTYEGGGSTAITDLVATAGENITNGTHTLTIQSTNTVANPATGFGNRVYINESAYFVFGHFVFTPADEIIVSKYTNNFTGVVGFKAEESIITTDDDTALYDNTGASPNLTSPGADRYKIKLTLIKESDIAAGETFIWAARVENGSVVDVPTGYDDYNIIEDQLAVRTREESGDYIVKPFKISFQENADDNTKLDYNVSSGTAYINGYRNSQRSSNIITVPKATTTQAVNNDVVGANYGNYFKVSSIRGLPNVEEFEQWNLRDSASYQGSTVGTARVRHVERSGSTYKYYLMDINMTGSNNLRNTKSIGLDSNNYANFLLTNNKNEAFGTLNNNLLFDLSRIRPSGMNDISLTVQRRFTTTTDAADSAQLASSNLQSNERWADTNLWSVIVDSAGEDVSTACTITGSGSQVANITNVGYANKPIEILAYVNVGVGTGANVRTKTLATSTVSGTIDSNGAGVKYLDLGKTDIYDVLAVKKDNASGEDYSSLFTLDNGQRDNYYDVGRLVLNNSFTLPDARTVYCQFRHFEHGATGSFFSMASYQGPIDDGDITYADIPSYRQTDGAVIPLSDVLDFRSVKDNTGSNFTGTDAKVHYLPRSSDTITADITYYEPRRDKIVLSEDNILSVLQGEPDFNPEYPVTPDNSMELFKVDLNPNTLFDSDLSVIRSINKRYTMADIDKLNDKVEILREQTALSLLELDTKNLNVVDNSGALRTKAGLFVDNFKDTLFSDTSANDYRATIDRIENVLGPREDITAINLRFDSTDTNSTNFAYSDGIVTLDYTEVDYIDQPVASRLENVNPFDVAKIDGRLQISPTSDVFYETVYAPTRYIQGRTQRLQRTSPNGGNFTTDRTLSELVRDVVLEDQTGELEYMRSRKIYFKATRLKPNQRMFAFFNQRSVADWVREEDFKEITNDQGLYGDTITRRASHPEGSTNLETNEFGELEGSFVIPSSSNFRFATGTVDFELLNVSEYDRNESTAYASHQFTSSGYIETRQQTIRNTRIITRFVDNDDGGDGGDPLAQTFMVEEDDGVFVTGVNVYFGSKPTDNTPVYAELRPVVNGAPSSTDTIPGSSVTLRPADVTLVTTATEAGVLAAPTKFAFKYPVYLNGGTEYAIVLSTNSKDYLVYTAKTDEFIIGSTAKRVNKQPSTGSLFLSSNMRIWQPAQDQDLTFKLERANFVTSGSALLENSVNSLKLLEKDPFFFDSAEQVIRVQHPGHGFRENDTVHFYGLDSATKYGGILGTTILDSDHPIIKFDAEGYTFHVDSAAVAFTRAGGDNVEVLNNIQFDKFLPSIGTLVPSSTSLTAQKKLTTGRSIAGTETRFQKDATFSPMKIEEINFLDAPALVAHEAQENSELSDRSLDIKFTMSTTNSKLSPVIDLHRTAIIASSNVIDKQVDSDSYQTLLLSDVGPTGENIPIKFVDETSARDGSSAAKHITTPISLAEPASGLKILLGANRPSVASLDLYYRTSSSDTALEDQPYILLESEEAVTSDDNREIFREYTYLAGGDQGTLDPFTEFQIKIVFKTTNSSKVPTIRDLRAIALVD